MTPVEIDAAEIAYTIVNGNLTDAGEMIHTSVNPPLLAIEVALTLTAHDAGYGWPPHKALTTLQRLLE